MEIREATEDEQEILDDRKAVRSNKPRKSREAPMRDLSDQIAGLLLSGKTATLVYKDRSGLFEEEFYKGSSFWEADRVEKTLRLYLNQKGISVSATLEWYEVNNQTKLIISARAKG